MKILAAFILIMASVHPEAHGATVENASRVTGSRVIDGSSECIINLADTTKHGAVQVGNSGKVVFRISNTGSGRGIITDITCSNHCFTTNLYGVSIDSGQQKKLEVYFKPVGIGIEKGVLSMRTNDPSKPLLTVMLYGKGMDYTLYFQEDLTLKETPYSSGGTWSVSHYLYTAMPPVEWKFRLPGTIGGDKYMLTILKGSLGTQTTFHMDIVAKRGNAEILLGSTEFSGGPAVPFPFSPQWSVIEKDAQLSLCQPGDTLILRFSAVSGNPGIITYSSSSGQCTFTCADPTGKPSIPQLISPAMNAVKIPAPVTLRWSSGNRSSSDQLQLATSSDFNSGNILDSTGVVTPVITVPVLFSRWNYYWRVRSINAVGASNWSDVNTFQSITLPPILSNPADNETGVDKDTAFLRWSHPRRYEMDSCRLQLATDAAFYELALDSTVYGNKFSIVNLHDTTKYFWRVKLYSATNSYENFFGDTTDWSETRSFTTSEARSAVPLLIRPMEEERLTGVSTPFVWTSTKNAYAYRFTLWENNPGNMVFSQEYTECNIRIDTLKVLTKYLWNVVARDRLGKVVGESVRGNFQTQGAIPLPPTYPDPFVGRLCVLVDYKLNWTCYGAELYRLQIAKDSTFTLLAADTIYSAVFKPVPITAILHDTKYYWRVRAENSFGESPWSVGWWFHTIDANQFLLLNPPNSYNSKTRKVRLTWRSSSVLKEYQLVVRTTTKQDTFIVADTGYVFRGNTGSTYWWNVRERDKCFHDMDHYFRIVDSATAPPTLLSPKNGNTVSLPDVILMWGAEEGAVSYQLQLAGEAAFTNPVDRSIPGDTVLPVQSLQPDTVYYWRVRSLSARDTSDWSDVWAFTTRINTGSAYTSEDAASRFDVLGIAPNPFSGSVTAQVLLHKSTEFSAVIYDFLGRRIAVLASGPRSQGTSVIRWDGRDIKGRVVQSGPYLLMLSTSLRTVTKTLLFVK